MSGYLPMLYYSGEHLIPHSIFDRCVPRYRNLNDDILRRIYEQRPIARGLDQHIRINSMSKVHKGDIRFYGQGWAKMVPSVSREKGER